MKCHSCWNSLGILILLAGCSTSNSSVQSPTPSYSSQSTSQSVPAQPSFANPVVPSQFKEMPQVPVPGLIQPTNAQARMPSIEAGRSDPFALLSMPSVTLSSVAQSNSSSSIAVPPAPTLIPTAPQSALLPQPKPLPTVALQPLPPLARPNSMPLIPISALPPTPIAPPATISAAEAIVITGAMQLGNRWNLIVQEPDVSSSRYVQVGDYLANGRVLVKRVLAGPGNGLIVILQQDGREISKPISGLNSNMARR